MIGRRREFINDKKQIIFNISRFNTQFKARLKSSPNVCSTHGFWLNDCQGERQIYRNNSSEISSSSRFLFPPPFQVYTIWSWKRIYVKTVIASVSMEFANFHHRIILPYSTLSLSLSHSRMHDTDCNLNLNLNLMMCTSWLKLFSPFSHLSLDVSLISFSYNQHRHGIWSEAERAKQHTKGSQSRCSLCQSRNGSAAKQISTLLLLLLLCRQTRFISSSCFYYFFPTVGILLTFLVFFFSRVEKLSRIIWYESTEMIEKKCGKPQ